MTRHSQWCPEDLYLCCMCFGCFPIEALYLEPDGQRVDVCVPCTFDEAYMMHRAWQVEQVRGRS